MSELTVSFSQDDCKIITKESLYSGFFKVDRFEIQHRLFAGGSSEAFSRELFERGEAAAVLLYDPINEVVVLTEQFRIGAALDSRQTSPWLLEVVAGIIEEGEQPAEVARREAQEEAGCIIQDLIPISSYWSSPGGTSEKIHLYCALIDSVGMGGIHGIDHEHEDILVRLIPCEQAYNGIAGGEINNAATIIALQWLKLNQSQLR
ncbi:MAG: NUDIX domain-containing protein [Oleispira antarctica]|nr:NUDIX domain-containing protein [Oleispira antarctica]MBQ0792787.1 NUDIX domain-containing protein [Oleispira antarctica]